MEIEEGVDAKSAHAYAHAHASAVGKKNLFDNDEGFEMEGGWEERDRGKGKRQTDKQTDR